MRDHYSKLSIKDSFEFVNEIRRCDLTDRQMASFDIKSLFTSVPLKETIDIIMTTIVNNNIDMGGFDLDILRSLLVLY